MMDSKKQQLCIDRYANDDWQTLWRYINCISYGPIARIGNEDDAARCTKLVGLDYDNQIKPCVEGPRGASLLRQSARNAQFNNIKTSCSIYIDGDLACVHDGTWKQCDSGHSVGDFDP